MPADPPPSPETLPAGEAQVWRTAFVVACVMEHLDTSENRSTEQWATGMADGILRLYRRVCEARRVT